MKLAIERVKKIYKPNSELVLEANNPAYIPSLLGSRLSGCLPGWSGLQVASCPPGWKLLTGRCYKLFRTKKTWKDAEEHCRAQGAHLPSIHSEQENMLVGSKLGWGSKWLGGTDSDREGRWRWSDGTCFSYSQWSRGEPDNRSRKSGGEDCLRIQAVRRANRGDRRNEWVDDRCNVKSMFVCKK